MLGRDVHSTGFRRKAHVTFTDLTLTLRFTNDLKIRKLSEQYCEQNDRDKMKAKEDKHAEIRFEELPYGDNY